MKKEKKRIARTTTTKKKEAKPTQALSEQINSYIDLHPNSSEAVDEIKQVLERTKKKKKFEQ